MVDRENPTAAGLQDTSNLGHDAGGVRDEGGSRRTPSTRCRRTRRRRAGSPRSPGSAARAPRRPPWRRDRSRACAGTGRHRRRVHREQRASGRRALSRNRFQGSCDPRSRRGARPRIRGRLWAPDKVAASGVRAEEGAVFVVVVLCVVVPPPATRPVTRRGVDVAQDAWRPHRGLLLGGLRVLAVVVLRGHLVMILPGVGRLFSRCGARRTGRRRSPRSAAPRRSGNRLARRRTVGWRVASPCRWRPRAANSSSRADTRTVRTRT